MKNIFKIILFSVLVQFCSCNDEEVSQRELKVRELTVASWGSAEVTHADGDLSGQYENFVIVFTNQPNNGFDGTFVISNGGNAFPENAGKWKLNSTLDQIVFDSGREINYTLHESTLILDFITAPSGGRVKGVSGHFIFELRHL